MIFLINKFLSRLRKNVGERDSAKFEEVENFNLIFGEKDLNLNDLESLCPIQTTEYLEQLILM